MGLNDHFDAPWSELQIKRTHLGDAVYANFDGYNVILTMDDGFRETNIIYLEPEVCSALVQFIGQVAEKARQLIELTDPDDDPNDDPNDDPDDVRFTFGYEKKGTEADRQYRIDCAEERSKPGELSDEDEYRAAHAAQQARDAKAMRNEK